MDLLENNKIFVKCKYSTPSKGDKRLFRAFFYKTGTQRPTLFEESDKCDFEYVDLSYLTSYTVEVCIPPIAEQTLICFTIPWLINSMIYIFRWFFITEPFRVLLKKKISTLPVGGCKYSHTCISHLLYMSWTLSCGAPVLHASVTLMSSNFDFADNDKAVIGFLVFLIILVSVALLLVVYKIFILKRGNSRWVSLKCQEWLWFYSYLFPPEF